MECWWNDSDRGENRSIRTKTCHSDISFIVNFIWSGLRSKSDIFDEGLESDS